MTYYGQAHHAQQSPFFFFFKCTWDDPCTRYDDPAVFALGFKTANRKYPLPCVRHFLNRVRTTSLSTRPSSDMPALFENETHKNFHVFVYTRARRAVCDWTSVLTRLSDLRSLLRNMLLFHLFCFFLWFTVAFSKRPSGFFVTLLFSNTFFFFVFLCG